MYSSTVIAFWFCGWYGSIKKCFKKLKVIKVFNKSIQPLPPSWLITHFMTYKYHLGVNMREGEPIIIFGMVSL